MEDEPHITTVMITKRHAKWISGQAINFSKFVRMACDETIAKEDALKRLEELNDS